MNQQEQYKQCLMAIEPGDIIEWRGYDDHIFTREVLGILNAHQQAYVTMEILTGIIDYYSFPYTEDRYPILKIHKHHAHITGQAKC